MLLPLGRIVSAIFAKSALRCESVALDDWSLVDSFPSNCFFHQAHWLESAWREYHSRCRGVPTNGLNTLVASDEDGTSLGISAWFKQSSRGIEWWRFVGSGQVCSDYVQLPSLPGREVDVAQATAKWFAIQPRKFLDAPTAIEIEGYRTGCPHWQTFINALVDRGWTQDTNEIESTWRIDLPNDWKEYESLLSKSRRRKTRRATQMAHRGELTFELVSDPQQVNEHWPEFVRLHQLRRQQLGQTGVFADANFEQFLRSATLKLANEGSASLAKLMYGGSTLGMLLIFQSESTWYIYQSGFDTHRIDLEPGHMINSLMLRTAIERGIKFVDFLRGDEHYKKGWHSSPVSLSRSILLPPSLASRGISSAIKIKRNMQSWL